MTNKWKMRLLAALVGAAFIPVTTAQSADSPVNTTEQVDPAALKAWREEMQNIVPPGPGCYHSKYPSKALNEIPCIKTSTTEPAPPVPKVSKRASKIVDGGSDNYFFEPGIVSSSSYLSYATGSFPSVTDVKSVTSVGGTGDSKLDGQYSLQLNTNYFTTQACGNAPECYGWQQFMYQNQGSSGGGEVTVRSWLVNYPEKCLSDWTRQDKDGQPSCYMEEMGPAPLIPVTQLTDVTLTGYVNKSNTGQNVAILQFGPEQVTVSRDNYLGLGSDWTQAEFNIFGVDDETKAEFDPGASMTVKLNAQYNVGRFYYLSPKCIRSESTAAESNNLTLGDCIADKGGELHPYIQFTQSYPLPQ
ncbi:hypothetical protein GCM10011491_21940 [Brucella endophytica]|uniref:Secreted protein n=1 Tax=Brucella endophytica TaxID=1963359 RepID=A0A916WF43_9HYPH|nr:hypothetical protein [Brucella endophytica]GGA93422.1 hypothetical protein GCM10011491_21940 [Brucella endophytica]